MRSNPREGIIGPKALKRRVGYLIHGRPVRQGKKAVCRIWDIVGRKINVRLCDIRHTIYYLRLLRQDLPKLIRGEVELVHELMERSFLFADDLGNGLRTSLPGAKEGEKIILSLAPIEDAMKSIDFADIETKMLAQKQSNKRLGYGGMSM